MSRPVSTGWRAEWAAARTGDGSLVGQSRRPGAEGNGGYHLGVKPQRNPRLAILARMGSERVPDMDERPVAGDWWSR